MAVPEVVDRIGEEAIEIIIIDSTTETIIDKTAEEIAEFLVEQPTEAIIDNTIDLSIELAVLEAAELVVDTSNEAILIAEERVDENFVDPFIELAVDRVGEEANEDTIDKIARIEAILDKIAGDGAINNNTIDPFVELVVLAADRVGEEAGEDIIEKLSLIQVLRRLLIILSIH